MSSDWQYEVPTSGSTYLPPDARYMQALTSQGYEFEVAIADLVDNCVDAGAKDVLVHFLRDGDKLVSLVVVDDGRGMAETDLDVAMTVGGQQSYSPQALGMFGTGLKSASLSHASAVTVVSMTKTTRPAGRRWLMSHAVTGHQCDIVEPGFAQDLMDRYADSPVVWSGTVIRWDGVKNFPRSDESGQTDRYLHKTINKLGFHLGLHFHRFLAQDGFNITISVEDVSTGNEYLNYGVVGLNPFGYPVSGRPGFPKVYTAHMADGAEVKLTGRIWPAKSTIDEYKAVGSVMDRQGFYFYRNNRLVQAGGWNNLKQSDQHLALARIEFDLPPNQNDAFRISVRKQGVYVSPSVLEIIEQANTDSGESFRSYLTEAESAYRDARKHAKIARKPVIGPGRGIDPAVRQTIESELPVMPGEERISIKWTPMNPSSFYEIQRDDRTICLNQMYRHAVVGARKGTLNDAPLVKSLLYLMLNQVFEKEYSGSREKDTMSFWQSILVSAARQELERFNENNL